jgi:NCS1 family nucleobase:cation symporter-1
MYLPEVYESPGAKALQGVDISFILALVISAGRYYGFGRGLDLAAEAPAIARSDRQPAETGAAR